jgi:hypothetical protein
MPMRSVYCLFQENLLLHLLTTSLEKPHVQLSSNNINILQLTMPHSPKKSNFVKKTSNVIQNIYSSTYKIKMSTQSPNKQ